MPGFIGVGAGDWTVVDRPASGGFYLHNEDSGGYRRAADGTWSVFGSPFGVVNVSPYDWIFAIIVARDDPNRLYVATAGNTFSVSHDGGQTWVDKALPFTPNAVTGGSSPQAGTVYAAISDYLVTVGIWRSTDDGASWTQVVALPASTALRRISVGTSKIWGVWGNHEGTAVPWFHRCNLDGSGMENLGPSVTGLSILPEVVALNDDLALVSTASFDQVHKLTPGTVADITPAGKVGQVVWAEPLTESVYLCATVSGTTATRVYRTTDAGASWTLIRTFGATEGFAAGAAVGSYPLMSHSRDRPDRVWMLGHSSPTTQEIVWASEDSGLTWTSMLNEAELLDGSGDWAVYAPGGIVAVGS